MKYIFVSTILFLLSAASFAQVKEVPDPKAKALLDELSAKTKGYTSIKADFTMVMQSKDKTKKAETQKGSLQLKGQKYKLEITGQEIISDGKTSWTFLKDSKEVQIKDADANANNEGVTPTNIFTIYEKGYKYKFDGENTTSNVVALFPNNPEKKKFHTIKLVLDKTKKQITSFTVYMKDGNTLEYTINAFETNMALPDDLFVFDVKAHPGVDVVDLR